MHVLGFCSTFSHRFALMAKRSVKIQHHAKESGICAHKMTISCSSRAKRQRAASYRHFEGCSHHRITCGSRNSTLQADMSIWHFKSTLHATLQLKCTNTRVGLSTLRHPLTPTTTPSTLHVHTSLWDAAIIPRKTSAFILFIPLRPSPLLSRYKKRRLLRNFHFLYLREYVYMVASSFIV